MWTKCDQLATQRKAARRSVATDAVTESMMRCRGLATRGWLHACFSLAAVAAAKCPPLSRWRKGIGVYMTCGICTHYKHDQPQQGNEDEKAKAHGASM